MKKKKINKKLPKYEFGTFKKLPAGYQQANGLGDSTFNVQQGVSIQPEVNAMRQSQIPNAIARLSQNAQYPLQALQNLKTVPVFTSVSNAVANSSLQSFGNSVLNAGGSKVGSLSNTISRIQDIGKAGQATNGAIQTGTRQVLNTAGKIAAGIGTAYGAYNVANDIINAGSHRDASDMDDTQSKSIYTTAGGNTYTTYGGANKQAELDYERQAATSKKVGLTLDSMGLGASVGSFFGPIGTGIGAVGGALLGGIASVFGFGDNSDEVEREMRKLADVNAGRNRMNQSVAESKDIEMGRAANGKMPGFHNGKANARVSNGEVIGNFKDGYFRVPGGKNNEDNVKTHLGKQDFVISNKHGLSDYAWLTGDIPGALAAQSYLQKTGQMNKYKNGRLPKFDGGTKRRFADVAFSMIPHGISAAQNLTQLLRAQNADIYAPDFYVENPEGAKAVNTLASLRFDADPYYKEAQRGLNQANWDARRLVGLGIGGRAIMQNANYAQYLNGLRDITKTYNEANNTYKEKYANALANLGATNQGRRMQAAAQRHQFLQQANAARENWMAQYRKNIDQNLLNAASEYMKWGQYNDSLGIQNKMLELYDRQITNEENKVRNGLPDTRVQVSNTVPVSTYVPQMIARPSDDDILQRVFATAPWRQKQQSRPKSVDPYTNIYNLAPWH